MYLVGNHQGTNQTHSMSYNFRDMSVSGMAEMLDETNNEGVN